jgi:3-methyladenine DNA glycosylase AlkD
MKNFQKAYQKFLEENKDPGRAEKEKRYLYSDLKHYGVSVWQRRKFIQKYKKEIQALNKSQALELIELYWSRPEFENRSLALTILNIHKDKLSTGDMPLIEKLMRESRGWAFLDSLIIPIMPTILGKDKATYKYLKKWIKDNDYWVRRSALLAQVMFFRENRGDKKLFYDFARSQFDESWIDEIYKDTLGKKRARFFIRKAIGWGVREISLKDPSSAYKFLKENKARMSGLSYRDGSRRLPANLRNKL